MQSKFLVAADTGMIWAASAFSHPVLGLYDLSYFKDAVSCENWTPKNKNQYTLFTPEIRGIGKEVLDKLLEEAYTKFK